MDIVTNGISNGAIYALLALGFVLIYRNTRVPNFCHAETGMFGAFVCWEFKSFNWPYAAAIVIGVACSTIIAVLTRLLYARRESDLLMMLIGTIGMAGLLTYLAGQIWATSNVTLPFLISSPNIHIGNGVVNGQILIILGAAAALSLGLFAFFHFSKNGLLFRAVSMNRGVAQLLGVNVGLMSTFTWAVAGASSGFAAILVAPYIDQLTPTYMTTVFLSALTAAVMAGMRSLVLCVVASLALGVVEAGVVQWTSTAGLEYLVLLGIVVVLMATRSRSLIRGTA